MNTLVVMGQTNITPWIVPDSYEMKAESMYESWLDGNFVEHRVYTRTHMVGSFSVWMAESRGMDADDFISVLNAATENNVTAMAVYDAISNSMKAINAYLKVEPTEHKDIAGGKFYDVFKIEVTER